MELLSSDEPLDIYQPFLPCSTQYVILNEAQRVLEDCFYEFVSVHMPSLLRHRGWQCSVAVELTEWTRIFRKVTSTLPRELRSGLQTILNNLSDLRNTAVHRRPISKNRAEQLLRSATQMAQLLQNQLGNQSDWGTTKLQEFQKKLSESGYKTEDAFSTTSQSLASEVHNTPKNNNRVEGWEQLLGQNFSINITLFMEAVRGSASRPEDLFFADEIEDGKHIIIKHVDAPVT
ncbi:hypothetical protein GGI35DRAFT_313802 [Trichoderma velutinum]